MPVSVAYRDVGHVGPLHSRNLGLVNYIVDGPTSKLGRILRFEEGCAFCEDTIRPRMRSKPRVAPKPVPFAMNSILPPTTTGMGMGMGMGKRKRKRMTATTV